MTLRPVPSAPRPIWASTRKLSALAGGVALLGMLVAAPLTNAFAADMGGATQARTTAQAFTSAASQDTRIDTSVADITELASPSSAPAGALYSLESFMAQGVVNWGGYKFTYYSQQVLPGGGLAIPGRHVNDAGYVSDADGYIVLAGSAPKGTVFETPFGYQGKIYDRGTVGNHLDVYIR